MRKAESQRLPGTGSLLLCKLPRLTYGYDLEDQARAFWMKSMLSFRPVVGSPLYSNSTESISG